MTEGSIVAAALLVLLVILPAMLGLLLGRVRASRPRCEVLLGVDEARARATLSYYNEVHDSHSG
jgi:hypothetical protein